MKQKNPTPRARRNAPKSKLARFEIDAAGRSAAQERASCGLGIDDDARDGLRACQFDTDRGPLLFRMAGNPYSRTR